MYVSTTFTINTDLYLSAFSTVLNMCNNPFIKVIIGGVEYSLSDVSASIDGDKITFTGNVNIDVGGDLTKIVFGLGDCTYAEYSVTDITVTNYTRLSVKIEITVTAKQLT